MLEATLDRNLWVCLQCGYTETQSHTICPRCGAGEDPLVGKVLGGRYRLFQKMAEGGMGAVYRAEHTTLKSKKERAVKIIHARFLSDAMMRKRFIQEVESTHRVGQETQHVVHIHDHYGFEDGLGWYVMELLQGDTLADRIRAFPQGVPLRWFQAIAQQICDGLEAIHQEHLVHRDLKPANLFLIDKKGQDFVKIVDFGIAKPLDLDVALTSTQALIGTPAYMSPEQIEPSKNYPLDHRSDIYSLGCVFYEMLTGRPPFLLKNSSVSPMFIHEMLANHVLCKPEPPTHFRPYLPVALSEIIEQMLAKSPQDRPQTVSEIGSFIQKIPMPDTNALPSQESTYAVTLVQNNATFLSMQNFSPPDELPHTPHPAFLRWEPNETNNEQKPPLEISNPHHRAIHPEPNETNNEQKPPLHTEPFLFTQTTQAKQNLRYFWGSLSLLFFATSAYFAWPLLKRIATARAPQKTVQLSTRSPAHTAARLSSLAKARGSQHDPSILSHPPDPPTKLPPIRTHKSAQTKRATPTPPNATHRPPPPDQRWLRIRLTLPPDHKLRLLSSSENVRLYKKHLLLRQKERPQMELYRTNHEAFRFFRCVFTISSQQKHLVLQPLVPTDDFRPNSADYCTKP